MDLDELDPFLERENQRLLDSLGGLSQENMALAQTVKLTEEVGELASSVLETEDLQRHRDTDSTPPLEMELADVLITTLLLAETLDVDVEAALDEKVDRIEDRYDRG